MSVFARLWACGLLGSSDDSIGQPQSINESAEREMKAGARCMFTVLNGFALVHKYDQARVEERSLIKGR